MIWLGLFGALLVIMGVGTLFALMFEGEGEDYGPIPTICLGSVLLGAIFIMITATRLAGA